MEIPALLQECGHDYPGIEQIVSVYEDDHIYAPSAFNLDFDKHEPVRHLRRPDLATRRSSSSCRRILKTLQEKLDTPVDIEFASRRQEPLPAAVPAAELHAPATSPAPIPKDIAPERIIFSANRYISNGKLPDITHIVYVDPDRYSQLDDQRRDAGGRARGRQAEQACCPSASSS